MKIKRIKRSNLKVSPDIETLVIKDRIRAERDLTKACKTLASGSDTDEDYKGYFKAYIAYTNIPSPIVIKEKEEEKPT